MGIFFFNYRSNIACENNYLENYSHRECKDIGIWDIIIFRKISKMIAILQGHKLLFKIPSPKEY